MNSEAGKGTTFELLLPLSESLAAAYQTKPTSKDSLVNGVLLVIDDEVAVREAVSDILGMEKISVLTAANGSEGIAIYKEKGNSIDLVLLDLSMPGISGQDTFVALQNIDANVRILLSSGYSETNATRGFESPSLVGFLQKPYGLDTFVNLTQKNLRKK